MEKDRTRWGERGFTPVEIMIVIIIIGLIAALVAPRFFGKLSTAEQKAAKMQIEHFGPLWTLSGSMWGGTRRAKRD